MLRPEPERPRRQAQASSGARSKGVRGGASPLQLEHQERRREMMQGPWLGIALMAAMILGLVWWCWWAMSKDKKDKKEKEN